MDCETLPSRHQMPVFSRHVLLLTAFTESAIIPRNPVVSLERADKLPTRETGGIPTFHRYWRGTQWYTTSFSMGFC
jgi:hypothetical protein